jgi:hypothetical protein
MTFEPEVSHFHFVQIMELVLQLSEICGNMNAHFSQSKRLIAWSWADKM